MSKYKVEITEYLQKTIEVDALDEDEAITIVKSKYIDEKIILSADDYVGNDFRVLEE